MSRCPPHTGTLFTHIQPMVHQKHKHLILDTPPFLLQSCLPASQFSAWTAVWSCYDAKRIFSFLYTAGVPPLALCVSTLLKSGP